MHAPASERMHQREALQARLRSAAAAAGPHPDLILLGDDIAQRFGGGWDGQPARASWREHTGACTTLNLGVAGDRCEDLRWRLEQGLLDGLAPRTVIVHAGLQDRPGPANAAAIAEELRACVELIRRACPAAHILCIDTVPGYGHDHRALHRALAELGLERDARVQRLGTEADFVNHDGGLKSLGAAADDRHLDDIGFELLACRIGCALQPILGAASGRHDRRQASPRLRLVAEHPRPVIDAGHPDASGIAYGLEGGMVVKQDGVYHLITAEMYGDVRLNSMRLAHWVSSDRSTWRRRQTIATSSGDLTGTDLRAALWGPMPIYDEETERWNLFYVSYRSCTRPEGLDGRIWRAVSETPGRAGIDGPWSDVGVLMAPGPESQPWEGSQGVDSFFPYRVGDRWLAFYGSSDARSWFRVGLAEARGLAGPWTRLAGVNPVLLSGPRGSENPIVTRLPDGRWLAMFETVFNERGFGYATSTDGVTWSDAAELQVQASNLAARKVRTPLGLIAEDDGSWSIFYTAFARDAAEWGQLWHIRVRLED